MESTSKLKFILGYVWEGYKWFSGKLLSLIFILTVVVGLSMWPLMSGGQSRINKNIEIYYKDVNKCLEKNSDVFRLDTKTETRILGRELVSVCKKESNALRGFLYENSGCVVGWYFFNAAEGIIASNAEAFLFRSRKMVLVKPKNP